MLGRCIWKLLDDNVSFFLKEKKMTSHVWMDNSVMTSVLRDCSGEYKKKYRGITYVIAS